MSQDSCVICAGTGEVLTVDHGDQPCPQCCSEELATLKATNDGLEQQLAEARKRCEALDRLRIELDADADRKDLELSAVRQQIASAKVEELRAALAGCMNEILYHEDMGEFSPYLQEIKSTASELLNASLAQISKEKLVPSSELATQFQHARDTVSQWPDWQKSIDPLGKDSK